MDRKKWSIVRFQCKLNCKITQANIVFNNWVWGNERGCTWEKELSRSSSNKKLGKFYLYPLFLFFLILNGHCLQPRG
jgi:hypothetical protein